MPALGRWGQIYGPWGTLTAKSVRDRVSQNRKQKARQYLGNDTGCTQASIGICLYPSPHEPLPNCNIETKPEHQNSNSN